MSRRIVLVVEDDVTTRNLFVRVVETSFDAIACCSAREAFVIIDTLDAPPAAVVVDVDLGEGGNGLDVVERVESRFQCHVPALVITGMVLPELHAITTRVQRLRAEILLKPDSGSGIRLFLKRVATASAWEPADVLDLDAAARRIADDSSLTLEERDLMIVVLAGGDRWDATRESVNPNTLKKQTRRLLRKTGHATIEALRRAVRARALGSRESGDRQP